MTLQVLGLNHHGTPVEVRERLAVPVDAQAEFLGRLRELPGVEEGVTVSTCNRTLVSKAMAVI